VSCGLRDVLELEALDTPAVLVASDAFVQAAHDQARKLGQPEIRRAFVAHPVQDRTDEELQATARAVVDDVLARLLA
jgi:glutamyl-tRNA reductase